MYDSDKGDPVTPCMVVYKENIQYGGSLNKLRLIFLVIGDLHNMELTGDTWDPTESMWNMKYFLGDASKHKAILQQLDFIGAFLQANVKNIFFVTLGSKYREDIPEYANYFSRPLRLKTCSSPIFPL